MQREKIVGSVIGIIFSLLFIYLGFWKTLLIGFGAMAGFTLAGERISYKDKAIEIFESLISLRTEYLGALCGIVFAALVLNLGFWRTIFIGLCGFLGYYLIKRFTSRQDLFEFLDRILPPGKI